VTLRARGVKRRARWVTLRAYSRSSHIYFPALLGVNGTSQLEYSDEEVASRNVRGLGLEIAHEAVSRRPLISLDTIVARTEKSSLGDAKSSLGDDKSSLGDTLRARWVTR
jgi:hypothetical protein